MEEPKPYASLTAAMLARKGHAKPAMRPNGAAPNGGDDLGWNDMGREALAAPPRPAPVGAVAIAPAPPPPVVRQQAQLIHEYARPAEPVRADPPPARLPRGANGKSAFTLRLDPERHVRLRLACAVKHVSAQQIVTEALDALLAKLPEIENLAAQLPSSGRSAGR